MIFHVNVADVLAYSVRLLRKAHQSNAHVQVLMGDFDAQALSEALWALPDADFLVHAVHSDEGVVRERNRVRLWLDPRADARPWCPVLVNLGRSEVPASPGLSKVIEIVGAEDAPTQAARQRWRSYVARGWVPLKHEASDRTG